MNKKDILKYLADNKKNVTPNDCDMEIGCPECREILKMECPYLMTADWAKTELATLPKSKLEEAGEYFNNWDDGSPASTIRLKDLYESAISELQERIKQLTAKLQDPERVKVKWSHNCDECDKDKEIVRLKAENVEMSVQIPNLEAEIIKLKASCDTCPGIKRYEDEIDKLKADNKLMKSQLKGRIKSIIEGEKE